MFLFLSSLETFSKSSECTIIQKPGLFFSHNAMTGVFFSLSAKDFVSSHNLIAVCLAHNLHSMNKLS